MNANWLAAIPCRSIRRRWNACDGISRTRRLVGVAIVQRPSSRKSDAIAHSPEYRLGGTGRRHDDQAADRGPAARAGTTSSPPIWRLPKWPNVGSSAPEPSMLDD